MFTRRRPSTILGSSEGFRGSVAILTTLQEVGGVCVGGGLRLGLVCRAPLTHKRPRQRRKNAANTHGSMQAAGERRAPARLEAQRAEDVHVLRIEALRDNGGGLGDDRVEALHEDEVARARLGHGQAVARLHVCMGEREGRG